MSRAQALFPGDRRVWWSAALVSAFALVAILVSLLAPRDHYTGTNSVRTRVYVAEVGPARTPLCTPPQRIPAGTGRIELDVLAPKPGPELELEVRRPGGVERSAARRPPRCSRASTSSAASGTCTR